MGDVCVKDRESCVYLYTHWGAGQLPGIVKRALAKKWRWDDPSYLARIIFDVMTEGSRDEETGFGISTSPAGDAWRLVEVDCAEQVVRVVDNGKEKVKKSFTDFIGETP